MGYTENSNKATSQTQAGVHKRKALKPLLKKIEYAINSQLMTELDPSGELEFAFEDYDVDEELKKAALYQAQITGGWKTAEMVAEEEGIDMAKLQAHKEEQAQKDIQLAKETNPGFMPEPKAGVKGHFAGHDGRWVTMRGKHVFITKSGQMLGHDGKEFKIHSDDKNKSQDELDSKYEDAHKGKEKQKTPDDVQDDAYDDEPVSKPHGGMSHGNNAGHNPEDYPKDVWNRSQELTDSEGKKYLEDYDKNKESNASEKKYFDTHMEGLSPKQQEHHDKNVSDFKKTLGKAQEILDKKKSKTTSPGLDKIDVDDLDAFEQRQYRHHTDSGMSHEEALQVIINETEGDDSQLSPKLAEALRKDKSFSKNMQDLDYRNRPLPKEYKRKKVVETTQKTTDSADVSIEELMRRQREDYNSSVKAEFKKDYVQFTYDELIAEHKKLTEVLKNDNPTEIQEMYAEQAKELQTYIQKAQQALKEGDTVKIMNSSQLVGKVGRISKIYNNGEEDFYEVIVGDGRDVLFKDNLKLLRDAQYSLSAQLITQETQPAEIKSVNQNPDEVTTYFNKVRKHLLEQIDKEQKWNLS